MHTRASFISPSAHPLVVSVSFIHSLLFYHEPPTHRVSFHRSRLYFSKLTSMSRRGYSHQRLRFSNRSLPIILSFRIVFTFHPSDSLNKRSTSSTDIFILVYSTSLFGNVLSRLFANLIFFGVSNLIISYWIPTLNFFLQYGTSEALTIHNHLYKIKKYKKIIYYIIEQYRASLGEKIDSSSRRCRKVNWNS